MAQRLIHIVLPRSHCAQAQAMLANLPNADNGVAERTGEKAVVNVLLDSSESGHLMDLFEKTFAAIGGFRMVLVPVEAAIPRATPPPEEPNRATDPEPAEVLKISREELYADIADSAGFSSVYAAMVLLSTVVAALGLLTGLLGINVGGIPIAESKSGFLIVTAALVALAILLVVIFKKIKWL